jgi:hypothetical protein
MKPPKNAIAKSVPSRLINEKLLQQVVAWNESFQMKMESMNVSESFEQFITGIVLFVNLLFQRIDLKMSTNNLLSSKSDYSIVRHTLKIGERYKI